MSKRYSELIKLKTFKERFEYLSLDGSVGFSTFGFDRYLNQNFYRSAEWRRIRDQIIVRDMGCDMGLDGYTIGGRIVIHHINPIVRADILQHSAFLDDPENLICVSFDTHNAIHYGTYETMNNILVERTPNDTSPWKRR